ncbi:MAG: hypothetical protein AAF662_10015 [Pseudomonadota bacterium]
MTNEEYKVTLKLVGTFELDPPVLEESPEVEELKAENEELKAENERLKAALTPSIHTMARYSGAYEFDTTWVSDRGYEATTRVCVPWTTLKEIMRDIADHALTPTNTGKDDG